MSHPAQRLEEAWLAPGPPERLALVRILVGLFGLVYLLVRIPDFTRLARMPARDLAPVGPLFFLEAPVPGVVVYVLLGAGILSGLAFVRGYRFSVSGPLFALTLLLLTSYRSSFGMIFHTENLLVIHTLILGLVPAAGRVLSPGRPLQGVAASSFGWPLRVMCLATTLTYLLAGIAKLDRLGPEWAQGEVLMGHVAYDAIRKLSVGGGYSPFGAWLLGFPWIFAPLASVSLVVELLAPIALTHRRVGYIWCAAAWFFHFGVWAMMWIGFPYPITGIGFASFFPVERALRNARVRPLLMALTGASNPPRGGT